MKNNQSPPGEFLSIYYILNQITTQLSISVSKARPLTFKVVTLQNS